MSQKGHTQPNASAATSGRCASIAEIQTDAALRSPRGDYTRGTEPIEWRWPRRNSVISGGAGASQPGGVAELIETAADTAKAR
jgi:hypothetical protein